MKLFHKFFLPFLLVALAPLLMMGLSVRQQVQASLREMAERIQKQSAERAADNVALYLENVQSALVVAADNPALLAGPEAQAGALRSLLDNYAFFSAVAAFDGSGRLLYTSARAAHGWNDMPRLWPALRREILRSGSYLSPAGFSAERFPSAIMAVPLGGTPGRPAGFLVGRMNLLDLSAKLKSLEMGSGLILVFDKENRLVAHSAKENLFQQPIGAPEGAEAAGETVRGDKRVWWTREPVAGLSDGWGVVFEQPVDAVFQVVRNVRERILFYFLGSVVLAFALCWRVTRRVVVNRLREIEAAVEAIQNHRFNLLLRAESKDEIGQLGRRVLEAAKSLETQVRSATIGIMVQKLSHDLRKPLTNIRGSLETARRHINGTDTVAEKHLGYIEQSVDQGLEYIEEILTLGKDRRPPEKKPTDVAALLEALRDRTSVPPGVEAAVEAENVPLCALDAGEAVRALSNIFENAIHSLPEKDGRITLRAYVHDGHAALEVEDNGHGMSEDVRQKLFDDFFTTRKGGTGLGMGIVKRVMERHQGRISVESKPGEGTTITLYFPLEQEKKEEAAYA